MIREILSAEHTESLREVMSRYNIWTVRRLIAADKADSYSYLGYTIARDGPKITFASQSTKQSMTVDFGKAKLTQAQKDEFAEKLWDDTKAYFQNHADDIKSGKIKAADIGGAVYGMAGAAIVAIFAPFAGMGVLGKIVAAPFVFFSTQKGRYWGAAVDTLVSIIKGESDLNKKQIVGVMATVGMLFEFLPGPGALIQLGGDNAWNLTVEIGKKLGGVVSDVEEAIGLPAELGLAIALFGPPGAIIVTGKKFVEAVWDFFF